MPLLWASLMHIAERHPLSSSITAWAWQPSCAAATLYSARALRPPKPRDSSPLEVPEPCRQVRCGHGRSRPWRRAPCTP